MLGWAATAPAARAATNRLNLSRPAPLVRTQVLLGLQARHQDHAKAGLAFIQSVVLELVEDQVTDLQQVGRERWVSRRPDGRNAHSYQRVIITIQKAVRRATSSIDTEKHLDTWDLSFWGKSGTLDFTPVTQPWLREATKAFCHADLPSHQGRGLTAIREALRSATHLSDSLRKRSDGGNNPASLSRRDIEDFLNHLAYMQAHGRISQTQRSKTISRLGIVLRRVHSNLGLNHPGGLLAQLDPNFTIFAQDAPRRVKDKKPRDLPNEVLRRLMQQLPALIARSGEDTARLITVLADAGRRPQEVCSLPWDCTAGTSDGETTLIYTDYKNGKRGVPLPIASETVDTIRTQQDWVRAKYPNTPLKDLRLFPRTYRNHDGTRDPEARNLSNLHRQWIRDIPADVMVVDRNGVPVLTSDGKPKVVKFVDDAGQEFDESKIVPYAYRHTYAQRHADKGTEIDVLAELLGHDSLTSTVGYYEVRGPRLRAAVDRVSRNQVTADGTRVYSEMQTVLDTASALRSQYTSMVIPLGSCTEPSNIKAGGSSCPLRYNCLGCKHFRTSAVNLPELRLYLDRLLDRREQRASAAISDWAADKAAPSKGEIDALRHLIRSIEDTLGDLSDDDQARLEHAISVVRSATRSISGSDTAIALGMPQIRNNAHTPPPAASA